MILAASITPTEPLALSSAPGARPLDGMQSRWAVTSTISSAWVVPGFSAMTLRFGLCQVW